MTVLLWGMPTECVFAAVERALRQANVSTFLLDQQASLSMELDLEIGATVTGTLRVDDHSLNLTAVTAAYVRPYDGRTLPWIAAAGPASAAWQHVEAFERSLWSWADLTPALVVNRPRAMSSNASKPYQLELLRKLGWDVPRTLVTTDPEAALAFWEEHGEVIYKSVSGVRSKVARLRPEHRERMAHVASCPTQFQEHIPGVDHRVHVVGQAVFACEVQCDADDYRYADGHPRTLRECPLPSNIGERCIASAAALRLPVCGIDLRRTREGRWYCFEVNPSPAFTFYESATKQPISAAIARLLADEARDGRQSQRPTENEVTQ